MGVGMEVRVPIDGAVLRIEETDNLEDSRDYP